MRGGFSGSIEVLWRAWRASLDSPERRRSAAHRSSSPGSVGSKLVSWNSSSESATGMSATVEPSRPVACSTAGVVTFAVDCEPEAAMLVSCANVLSVIKTEDDSLLRNKNGGI